MKMFDRYFGPYKVLEWIIEVTYRVELLDDYHIHNVFHVSLLKEKKVNHFDEQRYE